MCQGRLHLVHVLVIDTRVSRTMLPLEALIVIPETGWITIDKTLSVAATEPVRGARFADRIARIAGFKHWTTRLRLRGPLYRPEDSDQRRNEPTHLL